MSGTVYSLEGIFHATINVHDVAYCIMFIVLQSHTLYCIVLYDMKLNQHLQTNQLSTRKLTIGRDRWGPIRCSYQIIVEMEEYKLCKWSLITHDPPSNEA